MQRTIRFSHTPKLVKDFFALVKRIEDKIAKGDKSYVDDIRKTNAKTQKGFRRHTQKIKVYLNIIPIYRIKADVGQHIFDKKIKWFIIDKKKYDVEDNLEINEAIQNLINSACIFDNGIISEFNPKTKTIRYCVNKVKWKENS